MKEQNNIVEAIFNAECALIELAAQTGKIKDPAVTISDLPAFKKKTQHLYHVAADLISKAYYTIYGAYHNYRMSDPAFDEKLASYAWAVDGILNRQLHHTIEKGKLDRDLMQQLRDYKILLIKAPLEVTVNV